MKYPCPHCGQRLESGVSLAGERIDCPACGQPLVTPANADASPPRRGAPDLPAPPRQAGPWGTPAPPRGDGARVCPTPTADAATPADPPDAPPVDEAGRTIIESTVTRQSGIDRSGLTISQYMAEHGLEGAGVNLSSTGSSAADILTADDGRRYDMGAVVAEGGMGAIIDARDRNLRRSVAMKVLLNPKQVSRTQLLRFIEEAQVTAQLQHPGIVPTHELGVDSSGNPFYTMKMIRGETLRAIIEKIRDGDAKTIAQFPLPRLLTVFQRVCDAIAFAHSKRVIHRDLKPENIMVGEYGETLVMDWGLAKILPRKDWRKKGGKPGGGGLPAVKPKTIVESVRSDKTMTGNGLKTVDGMVMGTPQFMAPEQARGAIEQIDERTDVYALGAILYSILTLHPPISGKNVDEMLENVAQGKIPHPGTYQTGGKKTASTGGDRENAKPATAPSKLSHCPGGRIPEALIAVTLKALALEPKNRYPRVIELQREIEAYQSGFAVSVEQASVWRQFTLLVKRNKNVSISVAAAAALLMIATTAYVVRIRRSEQRALASEAQATQALAKFEAEQRMRLAERKGSAPGLYNSARVMIAQNEFDEALDVLDLALEYDPGYIQAAHLTAALLVKDNRYTDALACLERFDPGGASRIMPDLRPSLHNLVRRAARDGAASVADFADWATAEGLPALALQFGRSAAEQFEIYRDMITAVWPASVLTMTTGGWLELDLEPARNEVRSLEILQGIPLRSLSLRRCAMIEDLTSLQGMPLTSLNLHGTPVSNLKPLQGMPLTGLFISGTAVSDLTPLQGMPLTSLNLHGTAVSDLSPLQGMPLTYLNLCGTAVSDLTPLQGMPLTSLDLYGTSVSDLTPLQGMPLNRLVICGTPVSNLKPLQGMPLTGLNLQGTAVSDLTPLQGMPLNRLFMSGTAVSDLSPLQGMALRSLILTPAGITTGWEVIREMALISLSIEGGSGATRWSRDEFFRLLEAGEFAAP